MIQKLKRCTDSWQWKLNSKAIMGIVVALMTIIGGIVGRWTISVDDRIIKVAEACDVNEKDIVLLKGLMPDMKKLVEELKLEVKEFRLESRSDILRLERKVDKHISK